MLLAVAQTNLEIIMLSKINLKQTISCDVTYIWYLKYHTDEHHDRNKHAETDLQLSRGREDKGGMDWEFGTRSCELLYIEWINEKSYCIAQEIIFNTLYQNILGKIYKAINK